MIQLDIRSRTKNPTSTPSVVRNPTPPKKPPTPYDSESTSATLFVTLSDLNKTSNRATTHTYKMHEHWSVLLQEWYARATNAIQHFVHSTNTGADPGGGGAIAPSKTYKVTLFTMILYNLDNSIRDIRPFCHPLFCHGSVVKYSSSLLQ